MTAPDINTLRQRARAGDVEALTLLGKLLLTGDGVPASPREALACMDDAAAKGGPEATALVARFAGLGVLQPRNLAAALDGRNAQPNSAGQRHS